jgi:hypothetical protein
MRPRWVFRGGLVVGFRYIGFDVFDFRLNRVRVKLIL